MQVIVKKTYQVLQEEIFDNVTKIEDDYRNANSVVITFLDNDNFIYTECIRLDGYTEFVVR